MKRFWPLVFFLLACGTKSAPPSSSAALSRSSAATKTSILLILCDDLGWNELSCLGNPFIETPNIDRLAAQGALFTQAYSAAPNCSPSRAALQTGQYAPRTGIYTVGKSVRTRAPRSLNPPANRQQLAPAALTIAEVLQADGYHTGIVGKWHLGAPDQDVGPLNQGFDWSIGADENGYPATYFWPYKGAQSHSALPGLEQGEPGEYLTDRLSDEAIHFLEQCGEEPFFLYFSHFAPHAPFEAKFEDVQYFQQKDSHKTYQQAAYAGMIRSIDCSVGRLLDWLEKAGRLETTLIVFTSDNGAEGGYAGEGLHGGKMKEIANNLPLRGGKGMLFEGGIRIPMVLFWPGHIQAGKRIRAPAHFVDCMPTILHAAGVPAPTDLIQDGLDLLPWASGKENPSDHPRSLFWHFPAYLEYNATTYRQTPASVIRFGRWKLFHLYEQNIFQLYDLETDPGERQECSADHPVVLADLKGQLEAWIQRTGAAMPTAK